MKNITSVTFEDFLVKLPARPTCFEGKIDTFMRKGEVRSWKCVLTPKLELKLNLYTQNNLKAMVIYFPFKNDDPLLTDLLLESLQVV